MRYRTILALFGAACVAAGCTTTSQGQPQPRETRSETKTMETSPTSPSRSTSPSDGELPSHGAPKVRNQLDTGRYQQNPCEALTPTQLQELNLPTQGEQRQAPLGLACHWYNPETGGSAEIQWGDKKSNGLSGTYAAQKAGTWVYFIEFPDIEGFPAVASDEIDGRDTGLGILEVGVSDQLTFQVSIHLSLRNSGKKDPIELAVQVAGMMLKTMKAGG